jgi:hypothetical protein
VIDWEGLLYKNCSIGQFYLNGSNPMAGAQLQAL